MAVFLDAAYKVLLDIDGPLSSEEITRQALERGILTTKGKTPASTMSAMLYMDIKNKGKASRFIQPGPNLFALNGQQTSIDEPTQKSTGSKPNIRISKIKVKDSSISSAHELLDREIYSIRSFLTGKNEQLPTSEKICDWLFLCYSLGLYNEGAELFSCVDANDVNEWYFERTKRMARLCLLHKNNLGR